MFSWSVPQVGSWLALEPTKEKLSVPTSTLVRNKVWILQGIGVTNRTLKKMNFQITNVDCDNEFSSSSETEINPLHHKFDIELHIKMFLKH